jgi:serine/threonine protein phosphatase PrpC
MYFAPVVCKYSYLSKTGYIPGNTPKTNQDSYFMHINFANQPDMYLFGVCDGHGFYGGEVSGFIKQRLPSLLAQDSEILTDPRKALTSCIHRCNEELSQINLDVKFSGSTLNLVLLKGRILYCANVGDSRALLARQIVDSTDKSMSGKKWMSIALSRDHKPDNKEESERIYSSGGRVEAYQDEHGNPAGPARVWLKTQDLPGLAMSRSLGDAVAASVGVICDPEILELQLVPEDKFIVIGSDGVFEFITNEEIVRLVVPYLKIMDCEGTCEAIVREANKRWKKEEEVIDDITALCIFLDIPTK